MMRFLLLSQLIYPTIEIFDSRTDPKSMDIVINHECRVTVLKSLMWDKVYIQQRVDDECEASYYLMEKNK